ncbi:MAG TPA: shikimate dehydrogenase [Gemmatimonadaceae bacterium]|nr:shikimate dehydrogenase [Gemmatimonadaceae bacterium]
MSDGGLPGRLVLLGHPLGHSLSPVFQNAALRAAGINVRYEAVDVPHSALADTMRSLRRAREAGNVTIPYKEEVATWCDRLTAQARAVGAVNTFWTAVDGAVVGDNTDVDGFRAAVTLLVAGIPRDAVVAVLGAGGAAAAVLREIEGWPNARVRVYSRTRDRAAQLLDRFKVSADLCETAEQAVQDATLVVNATPVGRRADDPLPVALDALEQAAVVIDLVYGKNETALVRDARARGHRAMDGLVMLIEQGAVAFERWFGFEPERDVMWQAVGRDPMLG